MIRQRVTRGRPLNTRGIRLSYETLPRWSRVPLASVAVVVALVTFAAAANLVIARIGGKSGSLTHIGFGIFWLAVIGLCAIASRLLIIAGRVLRGKGVRRTRH